ncbi:Pre-mRNA-splicing factor 18 [Hanseniaspora uvarum DSM 2768]|nr:Pre-mRNA-splicing factor 18 [Hanseniaspora uvarum DSM 2768]
MESTNINAVMQKRIALRKKQNEEKLQKEKQLALTKAREHNEKEYQLTEEEQKQLDEDMTEEMRLLEAEEEWKLNNTADLFKDEKALSRKILTFLHKILLLDLSDLIIEKMTADEEKKQNSEHQINVVDHAEIYERSTLLLNEISVDMMGLLLKLHEHSLESGLLVSLATVLIQIQNNDKQKTLQAYLDLSIGKVVWPIGVQNIGIHFKTTGKEDPSDRANFLKEGNWIIALKRIINLVVG